MQSQLLKTLSCSLVARVKGKCFEWCNYYCACEETNVQV